MIVRVVATAAGKRQYCQRKMKAVFGEIRFPPTASECFDQSKIEPLINPYLPVLKN